MNANEWYRDQFVPVILGTDREGRQLARTLFRNYGAVSHLLCERRSPWLRFIPWLICHPISSSDVTQLALQDLAADIIATDRTPLLYITPGAASCLSPDALTALEASFILCQNPDDPFCQIGGLLP